MRRSAGKESPLSASTTATTPTPHLYPINLAFGKPYAASLAADPSYPDTGGIELTDGILDSTNYADPAWQGRTTTQIYSFTIDLGAMQVIHEVRSDWLQDKVSGIFLPQSVDYSVSADNLPFASVGTVKRPNLGDGNASYWYTLTDLNGISARYVRAQVKPGWNAGWTFIDEAEVRQ